METFWRKILISTTGLGIAFFISFPSVADEARELYQKGIVQFRADDYEGASASFRAAYKLKPHWKVLYNIGQCDAAAKRYGLALEAFEAFLAEGGDEIPPDRHKLVLEEVDRLRKMVGTVTITAPEGAVIFIDGVERGTAPIVGRLLESAGKQHKIWAVLNGVEIASQTFKVNGGENIKISLEQTDAPKQGAPTEDALAETGEDASSAKETQSSKATKSSSPLRISGIVSMGVGSATAVVGAVMGGLALGTKKKIDGSNDCIEESCTDSQGENIDQMNTQALVADVLLVAGAATAVTGLVLFLVDLKKGKRNQESRDQAFRLTPAVTPSLSGIYVSGRF